MARVVKIEELRNSEIVMKAGRESRTNRLMERKGGAWATSSQDYVHLAELLFSKSAADAKATDGNASIYAWAGIPLLFSALRALLIEANAGIYGLGYSPVALQRLARESNELLFIADYYQISFDVMETLKLLYEVRNEIVHPSHMPTGMPDNTPVYLRSLKESGLLQSTGREDSDYVWLSQLKSHRLFRRTFLIIENIAENVLEKHHSDQEFLRAHVESYSGYKLIDPEETG